MLRPVSRLPFVAPVVTFLQDALGWLHLWEGRENTDEHDIPVGLSGPDDNHLSPRP